MKEERTDDWCGNKSEKRREKWRGGSKDGWTRKTKTYRGLKDYAHAQSRKCVHTHVYVCACVHMRGAYVKEKRREQVED